MHDHLNPTTWHIAISFHFPTSFFISFHESCWHFKFWGCGIWSDPDFSLPYPINLKLCGKKQWIAWDTQIYICEYTKVCNTYICTVPLIVAPCLLVSSVSVFNKSLEKKNWIESWLSFMKIQEAISILHYGYSVQVHPHPPSSSQWMDLCSNLKRKEGTPHPHQNCLRMSLFSSWYGLEYCNACVSQYAQNMKCLYPCSIVKWTLLLSCPIRILPPITCNLKEQWIYSNGCAWVGFVCEFWAQLCCFGLKL